MHAQNQDQIVKIDKVSMMSPRNIQKANEYTYSRKYIDRYIRAEMEANEDIQKAINACVADTFTWLDNTFYPSKDKRLEPLRSYTDEKMRELMTSIVVGCAYCQTPELYTSITAQLASRLRWDDKRDSILTIAELIVIVAKNDLIDIVKLKTKGIGGQYGKFSVAIISNTPLSQEVVKYAMQSQYLPPLVAKPKPVTNNSESGYWTFDDSVTLNGRIDKPLALDVINKQNSTPLTMDLEHLLNVDEVPNKELDDVDKIKNWKTFIQQSEQFYLLIHEQSQANWCDPGAIYFNYKFDRRGRMYAQGYHISPQGSPYKKSMLEFQEVQHIEVPKLLRRSA